MELYLNSPSESSWRGAVLSSGYDFMGWYLFKKRDNFTFYVAFTHICYMSNPCLLFNRPAILNDRNKF
jgi:hypothetical protein